LRPALERRRPPLERPHDAIGDGEVVVDDVELADRARTLGHREDDAVRVGNAQLAPTRVDDRRVGGGHARSCRATTPRAMASREALKVMVRPCRSPRTRSRPWPAPATGSPARCTST